MSFVVMFQRINGAISSADPKSDNKILRRQKVLFSVVPLT